MKFLILKQCLTGDDITEKSLTGGYTGKLLLRALEKAGINDYKIEYLFPTPSEHLWFSKEYQEGFSRYTKGYPSAPYVERLRSIKETKWNFDRILLLGSIPLWFHTGINGLAKHRGVITEDWIATHSPEDVIRAWDLLPVFEADIKKANRIVDKTPRKVWVADKWSDSETFRKMITSEVAVDVETANNQITCVGLAPKKSMAMVIPFRNSTGIVWSLEDEVKWWLWIKGILEDATITKVFHNGAYDMQYFRKHGIFTKGEFHDTMFMHHSMEPEMLKSLGFLSSLYLSESAWKTLRPKAESNKANE